jgi:hypothetical protein
MTLLKLLSEYFLKGAANILVYFVSEPMLQPILKEVKDES